MHLSLSHAAGPQKAVAAAPQRPGDIRSGHTSCPDRPAGSAHPAGASTAAGFTHARRRGRHRHARRSPHPEATLAQPATRYGGARGRGGGCSIGGRALCVPRAERAADYEVREALGARPQGHD